MQTKTYEELPEAVSAVRWLKGSRPYLFIQDNPHFYTFDTYLDCFRIKFEERLFLDGREVDAGGPPTENFEILHVHRRRWDQRPSEENVGLMIHELTEGYLQFAEYSFNSYAAHVISELFEGDFREEVGLPPCRLALPLAMIPKMREVEEELREKVATMEHFELDLILSRHDFWRDYKRILQEESKNSSPT